MATRSLQKPEAFFDQLLDCLSAVKRPGNFYSQGVAAAPIPRLDVAGMGTLAFPLQRFQAEQLVALAERAPYGRGAETIVDTSVRSSWQLAPDRFQVTGAEWDRTLTGIVRRVAEDLGCSGDVAAEPYKLLLYDRGSFFLEHRDTEKAEGMFGTLVVLLPSLFRGGELVVQHAEHEVVLDLRGEDVSQVSFAAFYADCVHELRPITEGFRLGLIYNLVRRGPGPRPTPPNYGMELEDACSMLNRWSRDLQISSAPPSEGDSPAPPDKLLYVLEHHYTSAGLGFANLKGADAAVAPLMQEAARRADCAFHLAMVSLRESGAAVEEYGGRRGYGRRGYGRHENDPQDFEVLEVYERSQQVEHWIGVDDRPVELPPIEFEEEELCPPDSLENEKPDEQHYLEASGNEGASFDRTYRRAALVLWPHHQAMTVMAQSGPKASIAYLRLVADQANGKPESRERRDGARLASILIDQWEATPTTERWASWRSDELEAAMLSALVRLGDAALLERFLNRVVCAGRYAGKTNEGIRSSCDLLGWQGLGPLLTQLLHRSMPTAFKQCIQLFELLTQDRDRGTGGPATLRAVGRVLVETLPPSPGQTAGANYEARLATWMTPRGEPEPGAGGFLVTLFQSLWRLADVAVVESLLTQIHQHPDTYPLDAILLPATLALRSVALPAESPRLGLARLEDLALAALRARVAQPLSEPTNWAQTFKLSCSCADCQATRVFLADSASQVWSFKAAERRRRHVEDSLHGGDVDCRTQRGSSPHVLVCTKNRKSYEARCEQRRSDLEAITTLTSSTPRSDPSPKPQCEPKIESGSQRASIGTTTARAPR